MVKANEGWPLRINATRLNNKTSPRRQTARMAEGCAKPISGMHGVARIVIASYSSHMNCYSQAHDVCAATSCHTIAVLQLSTSAVWPFMWCNPPLPANVKRRIKHQSAALHARQATHQDSKPCHWGMVYRTVCQNDIHHTCISIAGSIRACQLLIQADYTNGD